MERDDVAYFIRLYFEKHGKGATQTLMEQFVLWGDTPRLSNIPADKYEALAERLVEEY